MQIQLRGRFLAVSRKALFEKSKTPALPVILYLLGNTLLPPTSEFNENTVDSTKHMWKLAETQKDTLTESEWFNGAGFSKELSYLASLNGSQILPHHASSDQRHYYSNGALFSPDLLLETFVNHLRESFPPALRLLSELFGKLEVASNMTFIQEWLPSNHPIGEAWLLRATEMDALLSGSPFPTEEPSYF